MTQRSPRNMALGAALVGAFVLVALMGHEVARRGRFAVPLSSYSTAPEGTKALALLARARGRRVSAWTHELTRLPHGRGVLVAVGEPWREPPRSLAPAEEEALVRWIDAGGTLVVLGAAGYVPEALDVSLAEPDAEAPAAAPPGKRVMPWDDPRIAARLAARTDARPAELSPHLLTVGLADVVLRGPGAIETKGDGWQRLATAGGSTVAVVRARGRGHVAVVASASFVTNAQLARGDHATFVLRLLGLGRGPVLLDEYHLGMASDDSLLTVLRQRGMWPALLQAALVLALLCWRAGARFGRPLPSPPLPPADATTYVDAVGRIYARAGDVGASVERLAAHALGQIAARHGVHGADASALAAALRSRGRAQAAAAVEAVEARLSATRARLRAGTDAAELVAFTRGLDQDVGPGLRTTAAQTPDRRSSPPTSEGHP